MSDVVVLAASLVAIALMVGFAWALGFRGHARIDAATLDRAARLMEPGARVAAAIVAADGAAALALLASGKLMAAKVMGGDVSARTYPRSAVSLAFTDGRVKAAFADLGFPELDLAVEGSPPRWLTDLVNQAGARA